MSLLTLSLVDYTSLVSVNSAGMLQNWQKITLWDILRQQSWINFSQTLNPKFTKPMKRLKDAASATLTFQLRRRHTDYNLG